MSQARINCSHPLAFVCLLCGFCFCTQMYDFCISSWYYLKSPLESESFIVICSLIKMPTYLISRNMLIKMNRSHLLSIRKCGISYSLNICLPPLKGKAACKDPREVMTPSENSLLLNCSTGVGQSGFGCGSMAAVKRNSLLLDKASLNVRWKRKFTRSEIICYKKISCTQI